MIRVHFEITRHKTAVLVSKSLPCEQMCNRLAKSALVKICRAFFPLLLLHLARRYFTDLGKYTKCLCKVCYSNRKKPQKTKEKKKKRKGKKPRKPTNQTKQKKDCIIL